MDDRHFVNDNADNDWHHADNWSATEGGAGGAGIPTSSDDVWFSDTSSSDACNISSAAACASINTSSAGTGNTDDYTGTITLTAKLTVNSGDCIIDSNTDFVAEDSNAEVEIIGSGDISNPYWGNWIYKLTLGDGTNPITLGQYGLSSAFWARYWDVKNNVTISSSTMQLTVYCGSLTDPWTQGSTGISINAPIRWQYSGTTGVQNNAITTNADLLIEPSSAIDGIFTFNGAITCDDLYVQGYTNGYSSEAILTAALTSSNVYFGKGAYPTSIGKLKLANSGTVTNTISGSIERTSGNTGTAHTISLGNYFTIAADSVDFTGITVTKQTGTLRFAGVPNATYTAAGQDLYAIQVTKDNTKTLTFQDTVNADSILWNQGGLIDNGQNVNISGNIAMSGTSDANTYFTSTGSWSQDGTGTLLNPNKLNRFGSIEIADGITSTLINNVTTKKLIIGNATTSGSSFYVYPVATNDFISVHTSATVGSQIRIYPDYLTSDVTQGIISCAGFTSGMEIHTGTTYKLTWTGDLIIGGNIRQISGEIDFNDNDVSVPNFYIGRDSTADLDLSFGSGTVTVTNDFKYLDTVAAGATQTIYPESATFNIGNDFLLTDGTYTMVWTKDSETVNHNGTSGTPTINLGGNTINDFIVNNSGVTSLTNLGVFASDTFTLTAGKYTDGGYAHNIGGSISIANSSNMLTSTSLWTQTETGNVSNPDVTNVIKQLSVAATGKTSTFTAITVIEKLIVGQGSLMGNYATIYTSNDDSLVVNSSATIYTTIIYQPNANINQAGIICTNWAGGSFKVTGTPNKITLTSTWNTPNIDFAWLNGSFDCNDQDVTFQDIFIGRSSQASDFYCGSGTITLTDFALSAAATGTVTLYLETSDFKFSGNFNSTDIIINKGTSTITANGSADQTITLDGQDIYNLVVDNASNNILIASNGGIHNISGTGNIKSSDGTSKVLSAA